MIPFNISGKTIAAFVLLAVIAITVVYINMLRLQIDNLKTENKYLAQNYSLCQNSNKKLLDQIEEQNKEVDKFKKDAERRLKERTAELEKAKKESNYYRNRANKLISVLPDPNVSACKSAEDLINKELKSDAK